MRFPARRTAPAWAVLGVLALTWSAPAAAAAEPLKVWVSILPQVSVVERIGGGMVEAHVLVGPGLSPATLDPTPQQMARLQGADLLIRVGVPFEERLLPLLQRNAPGLRMVDGRQGIELLAGDDDHGHGGADPHFWLDPTLMKVHARTICAALCDLAPQSCGLFEANTTALEHDLDAVDLRLAELLAPHAGEKIFAFHPAYAYLGRRYGLQVVAAEHEGKEPGPRELAQLVEEARAAGAHAIFVQPQFTARTAEALAEAIGGEVVSLDPLAPDYLANLDRMGVAIAVALTARSPQESR